MILVLGKSALSVPDTRFSRVYGSTLVMATETLTLHHRNKYIQIENTYFNYNNISQNDSEPSWA